MTPTASARMFRLNSIRALSRSLMTRPRRAARPARLSLGVLTLEDRVVPQAVDVAGVRFSVPGTFTVNPVAGGTQYVSSEKVDVGLVPTGGAAFTPLFDLDDGGSVTDLGGSGTVAWTNRVSAVESGGTVPLFAGADSQDIGQLLPTANGNAPTHTGGQAVPVTAFSLTPNALRIVAADKLGLAGTLTVSDFGGIKTAVALGNVVTSPTAATAGFAVTTITGGFQLGSGTNMFNVGGLTFTDTPNANQPTVGGFVRITPSTGTVEVAGQGKVMIAGSPVTISAGSYDVNDATKFVPGATFVNGTATAFSLAVNGDVTVGGVKFTANNLQGAYEAATSKFTLTGTAKLQAGSANADVNFGTANTPGLVLTNGSVTSAGFLVSGDLKLGGLTFTANNLTATYDDPSGTFTLKGATGFSVNGNTVSVNFGDQGTSGLVVTNGAIKSAGFALTSDIKVGGLAFTTKALTSTYDDASSTFTLKGTAGFAVKDANLSVTFGDQNTAGLVIVNGAVTAAAFAVTADFKLGGVAFTAKGLTATYDAAGSKYTITGQAGVSFNVKDKSAITVDVVFGQGDAPGLVIQNGSLKQLTVAVTSNFSVLGLDVAIDKLSINYAADSNTFGMFGTVKLSTAATPAGKVLDNFAVRLGQGSFDAPGIQIVNGTLTKLDIGLDGKFQIAALNVTADNLRVQYDAGTGVLQFTGGLKVSLTSSFTAEVALTNGGLTIDTNTGQVMLGGVKFRLSDVTFGPLAINKLEVDFTNGPNGVSITGSAEVKLPGNLTVGAGLKIINGNLDSISVDVQKDSPGIPLVGGVFITRISGSITGLTDPNNFMLMGSVTMSVGPRVSFLGNQYSLATVTGTISLNAQRLAVGGMVQLLEGKIGTASGEVAVFFQGDTAATVKVSNVNLLGVFSGDLSLKIDTNGDVTLNSNVNIKVPDAVPLIGGRNLYQAGLYLQIRPNQSAENSYGQATLKFGPKPPDVTGLNTTGDFSTEIHDAVATAEDPTRVRSADLNGDGVADRVVWTATGTLSVYDGKTQALLFTTHPFEASFTGDLHVTLGDVTGDGVPDIVVTPAANGSPRVIALDGKTFQTVFDFYGIDDPAFSGGTYAAVGDVNGDGRNDLVVTAGSGGGPRVAGYDGATLASGQPARLFNDFFAFDDGTRQGAVPLVTDLDGDGDGDLILANPAGGPDAATALSGADLLKNVVTALGQKLQAAAAAGNAAAAAGDPTATQLHAEGFFDFISNIGNAISSAVNTVATAVSQAASAVVDTAALAISFTATLKVDFTGHAKGAVKSGLGAQVSFDTAVPGLSASALDTGATTVQATDDTPTFDLSKLVEPTVKIESATSPVGTPTGVVTFSGTTAFPAGTHVDLYLADRNKDYAGKLIASVPFTGGTQSFTIPDLSAYAAQPYDPAKPKYVYAVINDGVSQPVYSNETTPLLPNDYSPALAGPVGQTLQIIPNKPLAFTGANALTVTDPLAAALPTEQVQLTVHAQSGNLTVATPDGLTVVGNGSTAVTLTGTAAQVNAALAGLTYQPMAPAFPVPDSITTTLTRFPQNDEGLIAPAAIKLDVTAVGLNLVGSAAALSADVSAASITYVQGSGPKAVLADADAASSTSDTLSGAIVSIGGYEPGQDILESASTPDIAARFDARTGTLSLVGVAAVEDYDAALRAVTFRTTSAAPKTLTVSIPDDDGDLSAATMDLDVTPGTVPPPPDASAYTPNGNPEGPTVAVSTLTVPAALDTSVVAIASGLTLTAGTAPTLTGAIVRIAGGFVPGEDVLSAAALPPGITARYDDATGILVLTGDATVADYQTALDSVQYSDRSRVRTGGGRAVLVTASTTNGVSAPAVVTVTVAAPPVVDTAAAVLDYTAGGQPAAVAPKLAVIFPNGLLDGATVTFDGAFEPKDALTFTPVGNITGSYDATTGVLTLTGRGTDDQYQAALRSVTYNSGDENPEAYERMAIFRVTAGGMTSDDTGTVTLNVDPDHVGPKVAVPPGDLTVPERGAATPVAPGLTITAVDPDDTTLEGATVAVEGLYNPDTDILEYGARPAGVTAALDTDNGELTFTGTASLADYQALLRSVTYRSTDPSPDSTDGGVPLSFYLDDGFGGDSSATVNVFITPANDPPTSTGAPVADVSVPLGGGAKSLGLAGVNYAPPAGFSKLVITVTSVPDPSFVGVIALADGTVAATGADITLDQLRGARFIPSANTAVGKSGTFSYTVAGIQDGAIDPDDATLAQSMTVTIPGVAAVNGGTKAFAAAADGTVTIYTGDGQVLATYTPFAGYAGPLRTATADFNGDGVTDVVVTTGPGVPVQLAVLDGKTGAYLFATQPFEDTFTGGAFVAAGDVTGDGVPDFAVSPDVGGGGRVRVFDGRTFAPIADFFGLDDPNFRGGVRVAIGDVTGDGVGDLIVAAGLGGGPRIAGYDGKSLGTGAIQKAFPDFYAFEDTLRNGATVAVGDTNGDNVGDLILGAGPGGAPRVRVLNGVSMVAGQEDELASFYAGDPTSRDGVTVTAKDLNGDAQADVVTATGATVTGYRGDRLASAATPPAALSLDPFALDGVYVG